ncbi:MAG: DnaB-like helicase C-terminal domain-containing protein [Bacteroidales bacterium]
MINTTEIIYLKRVFETPMIWQESRLKFEMFSDPLARMLITEVGLALTKVGTFIPALHLKKLLDDKDRLQRLASIGYPAVITDLNSLITFLESYGDDEKKTIKAIEGHIREEFLRRKLKTLFFNGTEALIDSTVSVAEILRKLSTSVDNLMYDEEDNVERYSTEEMVAKELQYQLSGEVQLFEKTGIAIIDEIAGGVPVPSLNFVVATGKTGKSTALYNSLIERLKLGKRCIFATIETNSEETMAKIFSCYSGFEYAKIRQKTLSKEEQAQYMEKVKEFGERFKDQLFLYYNKNGCSPKSIEIYWGTLDRSGIKVNDIFADYIGIMQSSDPNKKATVDIMLSLPKEMRILSQKTNTSVFTAQQLNSEAERIDIKDITFDNIYYSKTIFHEATNTVVLKRGENNELLTKYLPSRNAWTDTIYYYPNKRPEIMSLGGIEEFDCGQESW